MIDQLSQKIEQLGFTPILKISEDYATPDFYVTFVPTGKTLKISILFSLERDLEQFTTILNEFVTISRN